MLHWSNSIPFATWTPARYHNSWNKVITSQEVLISNRVASIHLVFRDQISFHLKKKTYHFHHHRRSGSWVQNNRLEFVSNGYYSTARDQNQSTSESTTVFFTIPLPPLTCSSYVHSRVNRFRRCFIDQIPFHLGPEHLLGIITHEVKLLQVK